MTWCRVSWCDWCGVGVTDCCGVWGLEESGTRITSAFKGRVCVGHGGVLGEGEGEGAVDKGGDNMGL